MLGEVTALSGIILVLVGCLAGLGIIGIQIGETTKTLETIAEILEKIIERGDEE